MANAPPDDGHEPDDGPADDSGDDDQRGLHRTLAPVLWISLAIMAVAPFISEGALGRVATSALIGFAALVALRRSNATRSTMLVGEGLVVTATLAAIASRELDGNEMLSTLSTALLCVLLLISPLVIVYRLARRPRITMDAVAGALAAYIQIGLFFAALYRLVDDVGSEPFFAGVPDPSAMDFQFFSFVTLTTLGYGNLVPGADVGESLSVFEAILGQVFLVTVVALAIGNLGSTPLRHETSGSAGTPPSGQAAPR